MKLSPSIFIPKQTMFMQDPNLEESGIIEKRRYIYLFFNSNDIQNYKDGIPIPPGNCVIGKAIQVNMCLAEGGKENIDVMPWIRGGRNSTYMALNMYTYDTRFENNLRNINGAEFTLINSVSSSSTNDYDLKRSITNGINLYCKEFREDPNKRSLLSDSGGAISPQIPEPLYYTMRQQEAETGDVYCLTSLATIVSHLGYELIDDNTQVAILDQSIMDTLNYQLNERMKEIRYMKNTNSCGKINMYDTTELSNEMMFEILQSLQSGYIYTYDTDIGRNVTTSKNYVMPFRKYRIKEEMVFNLQNSIDSVEAHAKALEKEFGHLRITYIPSYRGDKLDVYFKDYKPDHQPVIKNVSSIDSGNKIDDEITQRILDSEPLDSEGSDQEYNTIEY